MPPRRCRGFWWKVVLSLCRATGSSSNNSFRDLADLAGLAMLADMVIDAEKLFAERMDAYGEANPDTYESVGRPWDGYFHVQIIHVGDSGTVEIPGIDAYFTPTAALDADLDDSIREAVQATFDADLVRATYEEIVSAREPPRVW
ncbi:hypothetical protein P7C73_g75, partial [Tremellales sp. Uapishka_1]